MAAPTQSAATGAANGAPTPRANGNDNNAASGSGNLAAADRSGPAIDSRIDAETADNTETTKTTETAKNAETDARLRLGPGIRVFARSVGQWQIGTEHPRRVILDGPGEHLGAVLRTWTTKTEQSDTEPGSAPRGANAAGLPAPGAEPGVAEPGIAEPDVDEIARRLIDLGMLARVSDRAATVAAPAEQSGLAHRYGADRAELMAIRRADASIEVRGSGPVASQLAALLVAAGVGHVYQAPVRDVRAEDVLPPIPPPAGPGDDRQRLAERLASISEYTRVYPIPTHQPTSLVVLAGDGPPDATDAKPLVDAGTPHLAAWAGASGAVVGPLVLPGLSSCLWCAELARVDADPQWPLVRRAIHEQPVAPPVVLATAAAVLAAGQALELVEGVGPPGAIDGTFEWDVLSQVRRRSWQRHPQCSCAR